MANDVSVIIKVKENIEEFKKALINEEGQVDFNLVIPQPKELNISSGSYSYDKNLDSKVRLETLDKGCLAYIECLLQDRLEPILRSVYNDTISQQKFTEVVLDESLNNPYFDRTGLEDFFNTYESEEESEKFVKDCMTTMIKGYFNLNRFGTIDWYDWSIQNWGTKWNAQDTEIVERNSERTGKELVIYFITAWSYPMEVLAKLGEKFNFTVTWADELISDNAGVATAKDGNFEELYFSDSDDYSEDECYVLSLIIQNNDEYLEDVKEVSVKRQEELKEYIDEFM